jgi:uncharacterized coiled-coil DUF342 family protein
MNIQTTQPSAYAPTKADPLRLASATIQAVDRIGEATSEEIEKTASEITRAAAEIAEKLQELAHAIREHSKVANEHVAQFCQKATSVFDGIRDLQLKLEVEPGEANAAETKDEALTMPAFLKNGPAGFDDQRTDGKSVATELDFSFRR